MEDLEAAKIVQLNSPEHLSDYFYAFPGGLRPCGGHACAPLHLQPGCAHADSSSNRDACTPSYACAQPDRAGRPRQWDGTLPGGSRGMTLYILRKDRPGAGNTAPLLWGCTSGCAANWPAYTLQARQGRRLLAGPGVTGVLGVFTRPDGARQVTYNGWPLYYFAGDKNPGDVKGDGVGNLWAAAPVNMNPLTFTGLTSPLVSGVPVTGNSSPASHNPSIVIGGNPSLGDFLVDSHYRTLYVFRRDIPGASHCEGECAVNWPPYLVQQGSPTIEAGLTGQVGVITRPDGARQITVNGWPLYYFAGDLKPGDANGDGVNNNWSVIRLNGFPDEPERKGFSGLAHDLY